MENLKKYITQGMKNTVLFLNNSGTSYKGPWKQVIGETKLDRWHIGDFSSVEYTISSDFDRDNKELLKVLVTASLDRASIVVYARNNTYNDILNVDATVNDSYVDVTVTPIIDVEIGTNFTGTRVIFTGQYFHNLTPPVV
jgi:hemolysin activation/secretion protein